MSEDIVLAIVHDMRRLSDYGDFEGAQKLLVKIKEELNKFDNHSVSYLDFERICIDETNSVTIRETYNFITGNSVRLNPDIYPFSLFFKLILDCYIRFSEIRNPLLCSNTDKLRKIVAEEMSNNKMTVSILYRGIKPNRAFLDIAVIINPSICKEELIRREKVKLWKAIESKNKKEIIKIEKLMKEIKNKDLI